MTGSTRMVLPLLVFVGLLLQPSFAQGKCLHLFVLFIFTKSVLKYFLCRNSLRVIYVPFIRFHL
jgi:hypothetical protein